MAAVQSPPLVHRPSMDRSGSFESARRGYDRSTSPISRQSYSPSPLGPPSHSRTNSGTSAHHSPFHQPFPQGHSYFPPSHFQAPRPHPAYTAAAASGGPSGSVGAWTATPLPASSFYPNPAGPSAGGGGGGFTYPGQGHVFHQGFQQSQADFAAWAHAAAYQHMVMASVQQQQQQQQAQQAQAQEYLASPYGTFDQGEEARRRTSSGPASTQQQQKTYPRRQSLDDRTPPPILTQIINHQPRSVSEKISPSVSGGFHPYKRAPGHRASKESIRAAPQASVLPRSKSQPTLSGGGGDRAAALVREHQAQHTRTPSLDSSLSEATTVQPRPSFAEAERRDSSSTERARTPTPRSSANPLPVASVAPPAAAPAAPASAAPAPASAPAPAPAPPAKSPARAPTPLHSGPISNGTNVRPSPSAAPPTAAAPTEKKSGGLFKGRFAKALNKDKPTPKSSMPPPTSSTLPSSPAKQTPSTSYAHPSPSETSTRSGTPPRTPPQDLHPPSAPFAIHHRAMDSEVSLAETGRTERVDDGEKSKKRGLFRMKNMSTDNISLSSTVSSASMMIRKMGSIGKLARRNSLMGISKIFKDKPKDEDGPLPEVEGKLEKKERKEREKREKKEKKKAGKGDPAPTQIARVSAEAPTADNDDRALAGLTPAAQLARQHTLRSKADQDKRQSQSQSQVQGRVSSPDSGEPTWDHSTVNSSTRAGALQQLGNSLPASPTTSSGSHGTTEVVHVQPRNVSNPATVHHAVNVSEAEYDSEDDDSSDGETIEDVTFRMGRSKLSDEADMEFRSIWGNTYIDPRVVPKKGILKAARYSENTSTSTPTIESPKSSRPPSSASSSTTTTRPLGEQPPNGSSRLDFDFSFDSPPPVLDLSHPNSSLPSVLIPPTVVPRQHATRSMTVPATRRILWAPDCAVYTTYDAGTYDRRSEPATCNRLTPDLALEIKRE